MSLSLSLLGAFEATLDQRTITTFRSDKARALLVFLTAEPSRPHAREALAGLLWPDCADTVALTNLRNTLANLRQILGDQVADPSVSPHPFLLVTRQTVQINPAADVSLDTATLAELLAGQPTLDALERAVALCRGPFLEGFSIADSATFDEWLLFQREHVNRMALSALRELAAAYIERGRNAEAAIFARRQLALEPWDERSHQQLMISLALDGQRSAALSHYESCRRLLAEELGVAPASETTGLMERIRTGALESASARPRDVATFSPPFVARERELANLDAHLAQACAGNGRVIFVTGQSGSGKTTLINEFARRAMAAERDLVLASGTCNAASGLGDPHLPFREVVQMLTGDIEVRRAGGAISPEHARRLWGIVPAAAQAVAEASFDLVDRFVPGEALLHRLNAIAPLTGRVALPPWRAALTERAKRNAQANPAEAALDQTGLFEQVTTFLLTLAGRQPLIVLLDDLQWADAGSISLLFHLGRRLAGSRILVVGAYRAEDVALGRDGGRHPLLPVVHELKRDRGDIELDLNCAEGQEFVAALLDSEPNRLGSAFRDTLYHHTEGHPLFTIELLQGLQERGRLVRDEKGRWMVGDKLDWETLPARVEAVIAERIGRLPAEWQAMLQAASVEGEEFTAQVLARVQHLDEREVIHCLSGLLSHDYHIVRANSLQRVGEQSLSRYRFRHFLFRQYLYGELDELERACLHEATGAALEEAYAGSKDDMARLAPQLAWHFEQSGNVDKAVYYWRQAGDQAMRLSACEEAIANYVHGVALLATLPPSPERAEQELALQRAVSVPLFMTRGWGGQAAKAALTRAYALARTLGARSYLSSALTDLSLAYTCAGEFRKSLELGEELLRLAQQDQDPAVLAASHRVIGESYFLQGDLEEARSHLEQALALVGSLPPEASLLRLGVDMEVSSASLLAILLSIQGYAEQGARWSHEALARAKESEQDSSFAFSLLFAGVLFHGIRREQEAAQVYAKSLIPLATKNGWPLFRVWGTIGQDLGHTERQRGKTSITQLQQGWAAWQAVGTVVGNVHHLIVIAEAYRQEGKIEQGLTTLSEALSVAQKTGLRFYEAEVWRLKGELLARKPASDGAEAEECLKHAVDVAHQQTARLLELRATTSLALLWQGQGRRAEARSILEPIYGWFSEGINTPDLVEAHALLEELQ